jgi:hypothetical protein
MHSIPAKYRQIEATTCGRYNLPAEFPQEEVSAAQAVFRHPLAAPPLDRSPMQQVIRSQVKRIFQRTVRSIFHHPVWNEPDHDTGDDLTLVASKQQQSVARQ